MLLTSLPRMSRPHAVRELVVWALMALPMGVLSGGVAAVLASTVFGQAAPAWIVAVAIALLTGAGPLANMGSLGWAHWSLGRRKVGAINRLQLGFTVALALAAFAPINELGLILFVAAILAAQVIWCGIVTLRASIWRLNYDRAARFAFAADNQAIVSLIHAVMAGTTGWLIGDNPDLFRWILGLTSLCAVASLVRLRGIRVRRERLFLAAERNLTDSSRFRLGRYLSILRDDPLYRRYMICMMVMGSGNLMFPAPLILIMERELGIASFSQVLVTAALPTLIVPFSARFWARTLTRTHVINFRRLNSRWFALAIAIAFGGVLIESEWILWLGAVVLGVAIGGGMLGWNLGHNDFAPEERVADYLGLHVSLTGIRGLLAPLIGVWLYGLLAAKAPGYEAFTMLLPLTLTTSGSIGFTLFHRAHQRTHPPNEKGL
jgi:hypothetical protein